MTDWQCHLLSCPGQLKTPQYYFKIDFEDSITWSDISNKAILPCLNCVRTPESEQEVVIIDFGIIPGGEMISSLGTFPITLTYCIILWKPLFIFLLFFDTAVFQLFLSILLTYFHIFSTGFLFFLKYSLIWCIHDCSLSLNIYTTYHCKCKIFAVLKKVQQNVQMLLSCRYTLPFLTKYWATPLKYYFFPDLGILWNFLQSFFWQAVGIWQNSFNEATLVQQKLSGANIWNVGLISISVEHQIYKFSLESKGWKNWKRQEHAACRQTFRITLVSTRIIQMGPNNGGV